MDSFSFTETLLSGSCQPLWAFEKAVGQQKPKKPVLHPNLINKCLSGWLWKEVGAENLRQPSGFGGGVGGVRCFDLIGKQTPLPDVSKS